MINKTQLKEDIYKSLPTADKCLCLSILVLAERVEKLIEILENKEKK